MILEYFKCLETSGLQLKLTVNEVHSQGDVCPLLILCSPQVGILYISLLQLTVSQSKHEALGI